jgi:uncharacterized glyoxalase superfamily protein PhnB
MTSLRFDQINIVVPDVLGASQFLRELGAEVPDVAAEWAEWATHHVGFPVAADGFDTELDSPAFAAHWGGLPNDFAGVVINLRTEDRRAVDATFERAVALGAEGLRGPYDAFWGARYAVVSGPGPIVVGIMSPVDLASRAEGPSVSDFA